MTNNKIAFLFLIYDKIEHEDLWYDFFAKDLQDRHSIYIHYKYDKKLKYLEHCKLARCVDTKWGHISLVDAQNLLLRTALKDKSIDRFVFCSGSCVPLKSFEYIYRTIDPKLSYFNMRPDEDCFPRCNRALQFINKQYIKKASQWCILSRDHAQQIISTDRYMEWFKDTIGDEHCYVTYLHYLKLENQLVKTYNLAEGATTFTNWSDVNYLYGYKSKSTNLKNYTSIESDELLHLIKSPCLIGRKFLEECDLSRLKTILGYLDHRDKQKIILPWRQQEGSPVRSSVNKGHDRQEDRYTVPLDPMKILNVTKLMECNRQ